MAQAFSMPAMPMFAPMSTTLPSLPLPPPNAPEPRRASSLDHFLEQLPSDHPAVAIVKEPFSESTLTSLESQDQRLVDQVGGAILERAGLKRQREKLLAVVAMQHNAQTALEMANTDLQQEAAEAEEEHATKMQRVRDAARDAAASESRAALIEAQRVAEQHADNAETLRRRVTTLEVELQMEKDRFINMRTDFDSLKECNCCQMCGDSLGHMLNVNTGTVDSKLAVCVGLGDSQHLMCARCLNDIFRNRIDEGNLLNLQCAHCPIGGCFNLESNLDLLSPGTVAKYHEVKVNKEVTQRTAATVALAAANGGGPTATLSNEELETLPPAVQAELRRARAREHAIVDARTVKAPCCGRPVVDFDGCICIECDQCNLHWCALCFQVFSGDDEMHNHARREFMEVVNDNNRHNLPVLEGTYDYDRIPEAQRLRMPTALYVCPCHPHTPELDPFFFTSTQQRAFVKKCWESRVLSQMPKPFEGHEMEDPQGNQ
jgi:hypothetical protein